jgi:DNA-nicking Smr family endonuclease
MNSGDGSRRRFLSPEERVLWTVVTRSVSPLRQSRATEEGGSKDPDALTPATKSALKSGPIGSPVRQNTSPPPLVPLGRRVKQRVARGKDAIDGRLDLHGLTQREAHAALLRFLRAASSRGARLVLVITGKGSVRAGETERGILKRQVPQWLNLPEFRALIVGFEDAHVAHGGEGALYVRVRRTKG